MNMPSAPVQSQAPAFSFDAIQKIFRSKDGTDVVALRDV